MNALQSLTRTQQDALLQLVIANKCDASLLSCHMTRQQNSGAREVRPGRWLSASYDLMLCKYCGNLNPYKVCPAKARQLQERLTELGLLNG